MRSALADSSMNYTTALKNRYAHFCEYFPPNLDEYEQLLSKNRIWVDRLRGVGVLTAQIANGSA